MQTIDAFALWLKSTNVSWFVIHYQWVWPICQIFHFLGLALLFGITGLIDLRLLGLGRKLPFSALHRFLPVAIFGFAINFVTGTLFFIGNPTDYVHNIAFILKMLLIALAGLNVIVFYFTTFSKVESLAADQDAPKMAKAVATISLILWIGVMYFGRLIGFVGKSF